MWRKTALDFLMALNFWTVIVKSIKIKWKLIHCFGSTYTKIGRYDFCKHNIVFLQWGRMSLYPMLTGRSDSKQSICAGFVRMSLGRRPLQSWLLIALSETLQSLQTLQQDRHLQLQKISRLSSRGQWRALVIQLLGGRFCWMAWGGGSWWSLGHVDPASALRLASTWTHLGSQEGSGWLRRGGLGQGGNSAAKSPRVSQ